MNNSDPHSSSHFDELPLSMRASMTQMPQNYLAGLNIEQKEAVISIDGPLLVLAGAGTGKTRVLTTRIAHILTLRKAHSQEILAVTFTNKAAREMKERIAHILGSAGEGMPWLGTFHSICVKILRRHAELVGLTSQFTILDVDDQIRLIKQIIVAENIDPKRWTPRFMAHLIDGWKNRAQTPQDISPLDDALFANGKGAEIYALYQERLKQLNAVDFGDLLLESVRLFHENPDILMRYRNRFKYILVDEYQDTNIVQYLWLKLLARDDGNICCVGDDDQSIYGWRGAEVDNILRFEKEFKNAKTIRLEQNYRSTSHILEAASYLIAHNEARLGKTLRPDAHEGEKVHLTHMWDSVEEARYIGEDIERMQRQGYGLSEMAILVRTSSQMREFEERFITMSIPYQVIGGPRFYERMEIRDAIAYFRCVLQESDDLAFERIINTPKRGLGDATMKIITNYARKHNIPLMRAAAQIIQTDELKARARTPLSQLMKQFSHWRSLLDMPHRDLAEQILEESGYSDMWKQDRSPDAEGRLENLKELSRSLEAFESLAGFLEHIALVVDRDQGNDEDKVNIMTLHSAKGLEFDIVYLPGWEDGLFPSQRSMDEKGQAGIEEERRLAYVGITRAKKLAKISFANNRRIHGLWQTAIPSRFIDELPSASVEIMNKEGGQKREDPHLTSSFDHKILHYGADTSSAFGRNAPMIEAKAREIKAYPSSTPSPSAFQKGERIFHQKFGYGRITHIEGDKFSIAFEKAGNKKVLSQFIEKI